MKFDPQAHKFGMAYYIMEGDKILEKCNGGKAYVYVMDFDEHYCSFAWPDGHLHRSPLRFLTRAPEHDLIPISQLKQENAAALDWLRAHLRIADLHTHPEFKTIERLLGGESK